MLGNVHVHCVMAVSSDTPLPMQLSGLLLGQNDIEGTLPQSWSNLNSVRLL